MIVALILLLQDPQPKEAKEPWELAAAAYDSNFDRVAEAPVRIALIENLARFDRPEIADRFTRAAVIIDKDLQALLPDAEPKEIAVDNPTGLRWLLLWRDFASKEQAVQEKILALESVRAAALKALRSFKDPKTIEWIVAGLQAHADEAGREILAHALAGLSDDRINPALAETTKRETSARVTAAVIETLAARKAREGRDPLRAALGSDDWRVRLAVITAIPAFGDVQLHALYLRAIGDAKAELRLASLAGIETTGDRSLTPAVYPLLKDPSAAVRTATLNLLSKFGTRSIIPWVAPLFEDPEAHVRAAAVAAIEKACGRKGIRALAGALHRDEAVEALVRIHSRLAVPYLIAACKKGDKAKLVDALSRITGVDKKNEREYDAWWSLDFRKAAMEFDNQFAKGAPAKRIEILRALAPHDRIETAERLLTAMLIVETQLQKLVPEKDKLLKEQSTIPVTAGQRVWAAYYNRQKQVHSQLMDLEQVWNLAVEALSDLSDRETMEWMVKRLAKSNYVWEREGLAQAMGGADPAVVAPALIDRVKKDKEWTVRVFAIDGLALLRETSAYDALIGALSDEVWHVRLAAALALEQIAGSRAVEPLIGALEKSEGRIRGEIQSALVRLTGVVSCADPEAWKKWWGVNREAYLSGQARDAASDTEIPADPKLPTFWGFTVASKRVIFIVDISGSMLEECEQLPPPDPSTKDQPENRQKIHVAKYELRNVVRTLPEDTLFDIIAFSFGVQAWQPTLMPANKANKDAALRWIESLPAVGGTNTFDSLEAAFQIKGPPNDRKRDQGADTFFFVSDGKPSVGRITDPDTILSELRRLNQARRVKINTVAVGKEETQNAQGGGGVDPAFLKKVAEQNFGSSVWRR